MPAHVCSDAITLPKMIFGMAAGRIKRELYKKLLYNTAPQLIVANIWQILSKKVLRNKIKNKSIGIDLNPDQEQELFFCPNLLNFKNLLWPFIFSFSVILSSFGLQQSALLLTN